LSKSDKKFIYQIKAQTKNNGITITAQTGIEVNHEEAIQAAIKDILSSKPLGDHYSNFIVEPICTAEEWADGIVSFCPRCGANIRDYGLGQGDNTDCIECGASFEAYIHSTNLEGEDDE